MEWKSLLLTLPSLAASKHPLSLTGGLRGSAQHCPGVIYLQGKLEELNLVLAPQACFSGGGFLIWRVIIFKVPQVSDGCHPSFHRSLCDSCITWIFQFILQLWQGGTDRIRDNSNNRMCVNMGSIQHNTALGILINKTRVVILFLALQHVGHRKYRGSDALRIFTIWFTCKFYLCTGSLFFRKPYKIILNFNPLPKYCTILGHKYLRKVSN